MKHAIASLIAVKNCAQALVQVPYPTSLLPQIVLIAGQSGLGFFW